MTNNIWKDASEANDNIISELISDENFKYRPEGLYDELLTKLPPSVSYFLIQIVYCSSDFKERYKLLCQILKTFGEKERNIYNKILDDRAIRNGSNEGSKDKIPDEQEEIFVEDEISIEKERNKLKGELAVLREEKEKLERNVEFLKILSKSRKLRLATLKNTGEDNITSCLNPELLFSNRAHFLRSFLIKHLFKSNEQITSDFIYQKYIVFLEDKYEWSLPYEVFICLLCSFIPKHEITSEKSKYRNTCRIRKFYKIYL